MLTPSVFAASVTLNPELRAYESIMTTVGAHPSFGVITANGWNATDTFVLDTSGTMTPNSSSSGSKIGNFEQAGSINIAGESGKQVTVTTNIDHGSNTLFQFSELRCKWDGDTEVDCSNAITKQIGNNVTGGSNVATSVIKVGGKVTLRQQQSLSHDNLLDHIALNFNIVYS